MAQVFLLHQAGVLDDGVPLFYFFCDQILQFKPKIVSVYLVMAQPWAFYKGAFVERKQECPINIYVRKLCAEEERHSEGR